MSAFRLSRHWGYSMFRWLVLRVGHNRVISPQQRVQIISGVCFKLLSYIRRSSNVHLLWTVLPEQGKFPEALSMHSQALKTRLAVPGSCHLETSKAQNNIVIVYQEQAKYPEALQMYQKSLATKERVLGPWPEAPTCSGCTIQYWQCLWVSKAVRIGGRKL